MQVGINLYMVWDRVYIKLKCFCTDTKQSLISSSGGYLFSCCAAWQIGKGWHRFCKTVFSALFNAPFLISELLHSGAVLSHLVFLALVKVFLSGLLFQVNVSAREQVLGSPITHLVDVCYTNFIFFSFKWYLWACQGTNFT